MLTVMGKAEGRGENWHGHVTALTVAPKYRRLGVAAMLMNSLEEMSEKYDALLCFDFINTMSHTLICLMNN